MEKINLEIDHCFGQSYSKEVIIYADSLNFKKQRTFFGSLKDIHDNVKDISLEISSIPEYLSIENNSLLSVAFQLQNQSGNTIANLPITQYRNPYVINLNHEAILDCEDLGIESSEIEFKLKFNVHDKITIQEFVLKINLTKAKPNPVIKFIPRENGIVFSRNDVLIGNYSIINNCPYRYAEMACVALELKYSETFKEEYVHFGVIKNEIIETNPYFDSPAGIMEAGETIPSVLKVNQNSTQEVSIRQIVAQNEVLIPVYLDMSALQNPIIDEREEYFITSVSNLISGQKNIIKDSVKIIRDTTTTKLKVTCNLLPVDNKSDNKYGKFKWQEHPYGHPSQRFNGKTQIINIVIDNEAKNEGISSLAGVHIRKIELLLDYDKSEILPITGKDIFHIDDFQTEEYFIPNKEGSPISIGCKLFHGEIKDLPDNISTIHATIKFEYYEDLLGNGSQEPIYEIFDSNINIDLEKDAGPNWLCVDFGTSATVAVYGDGTVNGTNILDLDSRNETLLLSAPTRYQKPRFEEGTPFLSSNIMLREQGILHNSDSSNSVIHLAPSEPLFNAGRYHLPYLKALVGYKDMPNIDKYSTYKYKETSEGSIIPFESNPIDIDMLFKSTYHILFQDYIVPVLKQNNNDIINKIVLTIPNTYTPKHIDYIREIVSKEINSLRNDYIWFVSESDAIAYYYLKNWQAFNVDRDQNNEDKAENVLVYDMGAGTLDLTFFSINKEENGDKTVKILAKLGVNKAGNYIDYILAKALVETHPQLFSTDILNPSDANARRLAANLKHFVKKRLKPELYENDIITFSNWNGNSVENQTGETITFEDEEIDVSLIRSYHLIDEYISECTELLYEKFASVNNFSSESNKIDTLLMTGRSIQFADIRSKLRDTIDHWNGDQHCQEVSIEGNELKTIVSQGALYYAALYGNEGSSIRLENRNIYASYGVVFTDINGKICYQPLLNPDTKPIGESTHQTAQGNGMKIYCYDTDIYSAEEFKKGRIHVDMSNTIVAYLVQSYTPNTAEDVANKKFDYVTIMSEFSPNSAVSNPSEKKKFPLRIVVNERNEMVFSYGQMTGEESSPVRIDVEKNETFHQSMWPFV